MRVNVNATVFPIWPPAAHLRDIVSVDRLALARLEPVFTRRSQGAFGLDLVFVKDGRIAAVPAIRVAHEMLVEPETSPLLWPEEIARCIDAAAIAQIESRLVPWLVSETLGLQVNDEIVKRFGSGLSDREFDLARASGFAGAARYADVALGAAPYVYAQRFAAGATIGIADAASGTGTALLSRIAQNVRADLGDSRLNELACRWFGREIYGALAGSYDVGIGTSGSRVEIDFQPESSGREVCVATPVPTEIFVSFDAKDSPVARAFRVRSHARKEARIPVLAAPPLPAGGSSGKILILLPSDSVRDSLPEADDARELAARLRAEGFTVEIASGSRADASGCDLVHAFGLTHAREYIDVFHKARASAIPVVASAGLSRNPAEAEWGTRIALAVMSRYQDRSARQAHLELLARRRIGDVNADPSQTEPFPGYTQGVRNALGLVDVLLVSGEEEEAFARSQYGYAGPISRVAAYLDASAPGMPIDEVTGARDFVLCHAPIHGASNQSFLAQAARAAGVPLILAGPVADSHYLALLREELDPSVILWPDPSPGELQALYQRARVFADVSWTQRSLHRVALAAVSGCAVLVPAHSYAAKLWQGVRSCDVANVAAVQAELRAAWDAGPPAGLSLAAGACADPGVAFSATIQAYAQAQASRTPA